MNRVVTDRVRALLMAGFAVLIALINFTAAVIFFLSIFTAALVSAFSTNYGIAVLALTLLVISALDPLAGLAFLAFIALSLAVGVRGSSQCSEQF